MVEGGEDLGEMRLRQGLPLFAGDQKGEPLALFHDEGARTIEDGPPFGEGGGGPGRERAGGGFNRRAGLSGVQQRIGPDRGAGRG
jgi:hypothetical protein